MECGTVYETIIGAFILAIFFAPLSILMIAFIRVMIIELFE